VSKILWYSPEPRQKPKRLPRRRPIKTVPSGIGDKGIVANYLMYYLKGGDHLHDFSPKDNHGEIFGANWTDEYSPFWALSFDGVDDYVDTGITDNLQTGNFTVFALIYIRDLSSTGGRIVHDDNATNGWGLTYGDPGVQERIRFFVRGMDTLSLDADNVITSAKTWYTVAGVFDNANNNRYIYVNGNQEASITDDTGTPSTDVWNLKIGYSGAPAPPLDGCIRTVKIYTRALSPSKISRMDAELRV